MENKLKLTKEQCFTGVFFSLLSFASLLVFWVFQHNIAGTLALAVVFAAAIILHILNAKNEGYFKSCFAFSDTYKNRSANYDVLRLIACIGVIETHAMQLAISENLIENETAVFIYTWLYVICLVCNPIYVALSGGLLLKWKDESVGDFYLKRVTKIVIPLVIYFTFYLCIYRILPSNAWEAFKLVMIKVISGNTPESPHFWLIYAILSIYVVIPFFRYLFKEMSYRTLSVFALVILTFMTLDIFLPYVYAPFAVSTFMSGWIGVAVLGYWVTRPESRKYDLRLIIVGGLAALFMAFCIYQDWDFRGMCCNNSPIMVLFAGGIFALVLRLSQKRMKAPGPLLRLLSKYSYGIILIHWWSLDTVTRGLLGIQVNSFGYVGGIVAILVCTLAVSFIIAFVLDNLCVIVIEKIVDKLSCRIKKAVTKVEVFSVK